MKKLFVLVFFLLISVSLAAAIPEEVIASIPPYIGAAWIDINDGEPFFSDYEKTITSEFERYSLLDNLGRCGEAFCNVSPYTQPTEARESISSIYPSGWKYNGRITNTNYHELIDGNYLWNRCHLIGFQLAGENANELNLITGTRYLNINGMLPWENAVDAYVDKTKGHVLYRVTPIFSGDNLVADGVFIEGWSVEDNGSLRFCVWCYNVQPGITIDYKTGLNHLQTEEELQISNVQKLINAKPKQIIKDYVLNKSSKKYHLPDCQGVKTMAEKNRIDTYDSAENIESKGYSPCGICLSSFK